GRKTRKQGTGRRVVLEQALPDRNVARQQRDRVVYLDVVVVDGRIEVRQQARLDYDPAREGVRNFRRQIRVARLQQTLQDRRGVGGWIDDGPSGIADTAGIQLADV